MSNEYLSEEEIEALLTITAQTTGREKFVERRLFRLIAALLAGFAIAVTLFFAFYIGEHWPAGQHWHEVSEREAGRTLLHAWPLLDQGTKAKIIKEAHANSKPAIKITP